MLYPPPFPSNHPKNPHLNSYIKSTVIIWITLLYLFVHYRTMSNPILHGYIGSRPRETGVVWMQNGDQGELGTLWKRSMHPDHSAQSGGLHCSAQEVQGFQQGLATRRSCGSVTMWLHLTFYHIDGQWNSQGGHSDLWNGSGQPIWFCFFQVTEAPLTH